MADGSTINPGEIVTAALGGCMPGGADGPGVPRLRIRIADPHVTVAELRDHIAASGVIFDRGMPVRVAYSAMKRGMVAVPLTADGLKRDCHNVCRPFATRVDKEGMKVEADVPLPTWAAVQYLDWAGEWRLPALKGIASAPLLDNGGGIRAHDGYDSVSGMWCEAQPPGLAGLVPDKPTQAEAAAALATLRGFWRTFAFADARTVSEAGQQVQVVDLDAPPGMDESTALAALLTAVCRPSLPLAPGLIVRAAQFSGAGSGKGLLVRLICAVAFGRAPAAFTAGGTPQELDKRLSAELMEGGPVLFLDNLNDTALRSDILASVMTELSVRVRLLGLSSMVPLNASAFVALTGNGLTVREDLARRFLTVELDAGMEDPEARRFTGDILQEALARRGELLAALLTIWRRGRHQEAADALVPGKTLGSFETWCRWVRDPLLALGCMDPVARVAEAKAGDRRRQNVAEVLAAWHAVHANRPVKAVNLGETVTRLLDPQGNGRQYVAAALGRMVGTRAGGFVMTAQPPIGRHGATTYAVRPSVEGTFSTPAPDNPASVRPDAPYAPYGFSSNGAESEPEGMEGGRSAPA